MYACMYVCVHINVCSTMPCVHIDIYTSVYIHNDNYYLGSGCRELSNPANGQVDDDERRIGDIAIYSCNSGYTLVGAETRVCQAGGIWSESAPTCERE